ncbi:MAG TPA: RluA family pseudouridine synthase [Nannocystaceae bacterium]|nr:RluA family pseudouridine synthase [Nannocystaceae bacterium]
MAEEPELESDDDEAGTGHQIVVGADAAGGRLDAVIAGAIAELSRAQVQRLIEDGRVTVGGITAAKSVRVRAGDVIDVRVPPPEPLEVLPEPIPLAVLYEDSELIVIDKPPGLVVHPAAGHASGTLVNALLHHCKDLAGIGGVLRPGIVHRLDKDTSGVMVATKTERAHAALTAAFAAKSRGEQGVLDRTYLAIASPPPPAASGTLRTLYGRHPIHRKKFSSKVANGKPAVTHWQIVEPLREADAALVRLRLETGRTHQIRVHLEAIGLSISGDPVYGSAGDLGLERQFLHAARLAFDQPITGERIEVESPLPDDLAAALARARELA